MDTRVNTGEGPYHDHVGRLGKYDTTGVLGGTPTSGTDLDYYDTRAKGTRGLRVNWAGGGDLEDYHHNHKHPSQGGHLSLW